MKNIMLLLILLPLVWLISGCADSLPKVSRTTTTQFPDGRIVQVVEEDTAPEAMSISEAQAMQSCLAAVQEAQQVENQQIAAMSSEQQFAAFAMRTMAQALGQQRSPAEICAPGSNIYDYLIADTEAANKTRQVAIGAAGSAVPYAALGYAFGKGMDAAGDDVGGDKIQAGRDAKQAGRDISDSSSSADIQTDIDMIGGEDNQNGDRTDNTDNSDNSTPDE